MSCTEENPTQALTDAGVTLKKGITLKFVETEEAANALPANVFPLIRTLKNNEALSMDDLDRVAGGLYWVPDYKSNGKNIRHHLITEDMYLSTKDTWDQRGAVPYTGNEF